MPISDSCLLLSPAATDGAMAIEMGSRSDEPVKGSESISQRSEAPRQIGKTRIKTSVHITDESERSDCGKRNASADSNDSMLQSVTEEETNGSRAPKRKLGAIESEGAVVETGTVGETGTVVETEESGEGPDSVEIEKLTLPLHERIRQVEPLDISYTSTPASENMREILVSRLRDIYEFGRIQVVSSISHSPLLSCGHDCADHCF